MFDIISLDVSQIPALLHTTTQIVSKSNPTVVSLSIRIHPSPSSVYVLPLWIEPQSLIILVVAIVPNPPSNGTHRIVSVLI